MAYVYQNPEDRGMKRVKLTRKQYNSIFRNKLAWNSSIEVYMNDRSIEIHTFTAWWAVALAIVLFPVVVLSEGISNIIEIKDEYTRLLNQKKRGAFVCSVLWNRDEDAMYNKVRQVVDSSVV